MRNKILWITRTGVLTALLILLQAFTKPAGQLVTGSCVNAVLAVAVLFAGLGSGLTVALISPIFAFWLGIAPQILTVPVIMGGNAIFVALLHFLYGQQLWQKLLAWLAASACKFCVLFLLVRYVICGILADGLLAQGLLKTPMLTALPATFGATQLVTALIGGGIAMLILPVLRKALRR